MPPMPPEPVRLSVHPALWPELVAWLKARGLDILPTGGEVDQPGYLVAPHREPAREGGPAPAHHIPDLDVLAACVLADLAEEERDAQTAGGYEERWEADGSTVIRGHPADQVVDYVYDDRADHIARHDPHTTLTRVAATRRIIARARLARDRARTRSADSAAQAAADTWREALYELAPPATAVQDLR